LVESFKSTLDEVREADLLVHIVDISHPNFEEQFEVVTKTLLEINKEGKPTIVVFNKIDAFTYQPKAPDDLSPIVPDNISLEELEQTWMSKIHDDCLFISAKEKLHIDILKDTLYKRIREIHITRFPYNDFLFPKDLDWKDDNDESIIANNIIPVE
jgi:GTP-binding protein HflX